MPLKPFSIPFSQQAVDDLHARLDRTRWPDAIADSGWEYGFDLRFLQEICAYWRDRFDWKIQVEKLSAFHHRRYVSNGIGIHFIHERGKGPAPIPVILTHGWPGSFLEMMRIIPLLTDPASHGANHADSFDVVVPSLPGYGFSDRPTHRGMNTFRIAELWAGLMAELGYNRFAAQGGDIGAGVTTILGLRHADRMIGIHLNHIPFGLNDSPAGLAAWILEKFREWSDCDGDLYRRFTRDELLANVTLYWMTETIHSSFRLYFEGRKAPLQFGPADFVHVPCAIAHFPKELLFPPREWVERGYNIQHWRDMPHGGHFAAAEEPELLAEDIRTFFRQLR